MKKCPKCKKLKRSDQFTNNRSTKDGLSWHCKTCQSKYYEQNKDALLSTRKQRSKINPEKYIEQTKKNRKFKHKWKTYKVPKKMRRAISKVSYAVITGALPPVKSMPCHDCNEVFSVQYHHEDYDKPLEVIPLCRHCHRLRHGKPDHLRQALKAAGQYQTIEGVPRRTN